MINDNIIIYFTSFMIGISSSAHCIGMCSSIAIFFSVKTSKKEKKKIILSYNIGRILSYSIIGLIGGILGTTIFNLINKEISIFIIKIINGSVMILFGLYLLGFLNKIKIIENILLKTYYNIKFIDDKLFPIDTYFKGILIGMFWGLLPCGLIYSVFLWSLNSETIIKSFLIMTFFGLGTFPSMFFLEYSIDIIKNINKYKKIINYIIIILGIFIIYQAITNNNCH